MLVELQRAFHKAQSHNKSSLLHYVQVFQEEFIKLVVICAFFDKLVTNGKINLANVCMKPLCHVHLNLYVSQSD